MASTARPSSAKPRARCRNLPDFDNEVPPTALSPAVLPSPPPAPPDRTRRPPPAHHNDFPGNAHDHAHPTRRFAQLALIALVGLGALSQARPALAQAARDPQAEQFVQTRAQRVITVLADKNQSVAQKKATFHQAIDELADVPKITNFVLGKYARTITPDQRQRFAAAFRVYAESVYQNRISDYHGEVLKVTGSTVRKPGDVIVNTTISGGQTRPAGAGVVAGDGRRDLVEGRRRPVQGRVAGDHPAAGLRFDHRQRRRQYRRADQPIAAGRPASRVALRARRPFGRSASQGLRKDMGLREQWAETLMGLLVLVLAAGFLVYSLTVGGVGSKPGGYDVTAKFGQVGSLAPGAAVSVAGVKVGTVSEIRLDPKTYLAVTKLSLDPTSSCRRTPPPRSPATACWAASTWRSRPAARPTTSSRAARSTTPRARSTCSA
jgi:ABC-type transporter MlaC component